jgi:hypothetical protein
MKRHWSTRVLAASLALWFGLAMVGPELHQCPLHDAPSAPAAGAHAGHGSHDAPQQHQHCSCPQACSTVGVGVALPGTSFRWTAVAAPVATTAPVFYRVVLPTAPRHLLPFALAPPRALA